MLFLSTQTPQPKSNQPKSKAAPHKVVIVGAGFAGLHAAKQLNHPNIEVTLIDKRNFHLFQPLLYQVATGVLSPGDISSPIRAIMNGHENVNVLMGEVFGIDPKAKTIRVKGIPDVAYDSLIIGTGVSHQYFGNEHWSTLAPGVKTVEDALEVRRRALLTFEALETETDPEIRETLSTFVVVGGGATGVELAGALAELAHGTLRRDFRSQDVSKTRIFLIQGQDRLLKHYSSESSTAAELGLQKLGVTVLTKSRVHNIEGDVVTLKQGDDIQQIRAATILWTAGVKASPVAKVLAEKTGVSLDPRSQRVMVEPDFSLPGYPNIFVIGDLCHYAHHKEGQPLPGIAPVAMQAGQYVAGVIERRLSGRTIAPFRYKDTGRLAVIGRHAAVIEYGPLKLSGLLAWLGWLFVHVYFLIEFDNKMIVMFQWFWNYFTYRRRGRLITNLSSCGSGCQSKLHKHWSKRLKVADRDVSGQVAA